MRQTLLKHTNKLLESEHRTVSLQFEIERLQEELSDKKVEVEKCPKPGEDIAALLQDKKDIMGLKHEIL